LAHCTWPIIIAKENDEPSSIADVEGHAVAEAMSLIRKDEFGVFRVGNTHVMLDSVVAAFTQGHSPETIRQQYPALTLQQVYSAIAEYLGNREEFDAYLQRQDQIWLQARHDAEKQKSAVVERLRNAQAVEAK
jgi:uncharacterized protein (DUF433 family)